MRSALKQLVADHFPQVAADILQPLAQLLQQARALCGGDIDKFVILMLIALRMAQHREFRTATPEKIGRGELAILPSLGINVRSIAESLGVPKETVRRKVNEMVAEGWVVRVERRLYVTARAYHDLAPMRGDLETLMVRYHEIVVQLQSLGPRA